jgi:hypothetical protein
LSLADRGFLKIRRRRRMTLGGTTTFFKYFAITREAISLNDRGRRQLRIHSATVIAYNLILQTPDQLAVSENLFIQSRNLFDF